MKNNEQYQEYEKCFNTFFLEEEDKKELKENNQKGKENFWFVKIVFSETISSLRYIFCHVHTNIPQTHKKSIRSHVITHTLK